MKSKKFIIIFFLLFGALLHAQDEPVYSADFDAWADSMKTKLDSLITLFNAEDFSSSAKQDSIEATLNAMQTLLNSLDGKDFATSAKQDIQETTLNNIETLITTLNGYIDQLEGYLDGVEGSLTTLNAKDFSTSAKQDIQETTLNNIETLITTLNGYIDQLEGYLDGVEASLTAIDGNTDRYTTPGDTVITITTSPTQLPNVAIKWFSVQNPSQTGSIYFKTDNTVSTTNYAFELAARKGAWGIEGTNLNQWYARTSSGSISLHIFYQN